MTLIVDDLENRQLVVRTPSQGDRRAKLVTITDSGREAAARVMNILLTPPPPMRRLSDEDFAALERIVGLLAADE